MNRRFSADQRRPRFLRQGVTQHAAFNVKVARGLQARRQVHRDTRDLLANDLL
jgi:hypothetical protein